jgi:hypothetical protein
MNSGFQRISFQLSKTSHVQATFPTVVAASVRFASWPCVGERSTGGGGGCSGSGSTIVVVVVSPQGMTLHLAISILLSIGLDSLHPVHPSSFLLEWPTAQLPPITKSPAGSQSTTPKGATPKVGKTDKEDKLAGSTQVTPKGGVKAVPPPAPLSDRSNAAVAASIQCT